MTIAPLGRPTPHAIEPDALRGPTRYELEARHRESIQRIERARCALSGSRDVPPSLLAAVIVGEMIAVRRERLAQSEAQVAEELRIDTRFAAYCQRLALAARDGICSHSAMRAEIEAGVRAATGAMLPEYDWRRGESTGGQAASGTRDEDRDA